MANDAPALQRTSKKKTTDEWIPFEVTVRTGRPTQLTRNEADHGPDPEGLAWMWSEEIPPDCQVLLRLRDAGEVSKHQSAAVEQGRTDDDFHRFFKDVTIASCETKPVDGRGDWFFARVTGHCRNGQMSNARWDLLKWQFRVVFLKADGSSEHEDIWWPNVYFTPPFINRPKKAKDPVPAPLSPKVDYIDEFGPMCPIEVGFTSRLRRGNSGVFDVSFSLEDGPLDRWTGKPGKLSDTFHCIYDFEKGLLLETHSEPVLHRDGAIVFYPPGPRYIRSRDGTKTYWSWHDGDVQFSEVKDESWAAGVERYLSDEQFEEWAMAVLRTLREKAFSKASDT